jgi:transposase
VDSLGRPLHIHLTAGNIHDVTEAPTLIAAAQGKSFIADKGYDSNAVVDAIQQRGMKVVIPPKSNRNDKRKFSRKLYRTRHFVENFFCKIKRYRRVATRYDKTSTNFLGFVLFAAVRVWLA